MKLRVTGLLLAILVLVAVMVPAFAAAVDRLDDGERDASTGSDITIESAGNGPVTEKEESLPLLPDASTGSDLAIESVRNGSVTEEKESLPPLTKPIYTDAYFGKAESVEEEIESDSPFYLDGRQMTDLVYKQFSGVDYVTVESFLLSMNPETIVEERDGVVSASAVTLSGVLELENKGELMANAEEETLTLRAEKGEYYVEANGRYLYVKNTVKTIDGKVAAPIKVLAKVFNLKVKYDDNDLIQLTTKDGADAYLEDGDSYYNEYTLYWLSRIIYSESGNQPMKGKIAVGNVVMNRMKSPKFPNNIKAVLFQKNQFSPAMSGSIYRKPNGDSVIAAKMVMDGAVVLKYALFFNREGMDTYASRNRTYVTTIGGHDFYN